MNRTPRHLLTVVTLVLLTFVLVGAAANPAMAEPALAVPTDDTGGGVMGPLNPTDANGVRLDHYDIMADDGAADFGKKTLLFFTNLVFALDRWVVGLAAWLIDWVLDFKVATYLLAPVIKLSNVLESHLINGTGLEGFALVLAAVMCGVWILTGRRSRGVSEIATTLVIAAAATVYVAAPATTIFGTSGLLNKTRDLSLEVAALVTSDGTSDTGGSGRVSGRVRGMLVDTFVRKPHEVINYGAVLDADPAKPHKCLDVYNTIVTDGPWGNQHEPRARMAGCDQALADFNANPTMDRFGAAMLALVAALFVSVLAIVIGVVLLGTQLWLVFEAIRLMFALVIGLVPGAGRAQLWKALGGLAAALASVVVTIVFLALFVVLTRALLSAAASESLFVRFLLLDVAIVAGLLWYRRIIAAGRATAARLSTRLGARTSPDTPRPAKLWQDTKTEWNRLHLNELRPRQIRRRVGQARQHVDNLRQGRVARGARWVAGRLPIPKRHRRKPLLQQTKTSGKAQGKTFGANQRAGEPNRRTRKQPDQTNGFNRLRRRASRPKTTSTLREAGRRTKPGKTAKPVPAKARTEQPRSGKLAARARSSSQSVQPAKGEKAIVGQRRMQFERPQPLPRQAGRSATPRRRS